MSEELRYSIDTTLTNSGGEYYIPWQMVTNQVGVKAERVVGELCQLVELMNLPEKQEKTFKAKLKQTVYKAANDSLDWMAESLKEAKGEMVYLKQGPCEPTRHE